MADANQVRPNYGGMPKGKANIMRMGQTENDAWGQDPDAKGHIPMVKDAPNLGSGV
jgi:hypothetical protein